MYVYCWFAQFNCCLSLASVPASHDVTPSPRHWTSVCQQVKHFQVCCRTYNVYSVGQMRHTAEWLFQLYTVQQWVDLTSGPTQYRVKCCGVLNVIEIYCTTKILLVLCSNFHMLQNQIWQIQWWSSNNTSKYVDVMRHVVVDIHFQLKYPWSTVVHFWHNPSSTPIWMIFYRKFIETFGTGYCTNGTDFMLVPASYRLCVFGIRL